MSIESDIDSILATFQQQSDKTHEITRYFKNLSLSYNNVVQFVNKVSSLTTGALLLRPIFVDIIDYLLNIEYSDELPIINQFLLDSLQNGKINVSLDVEELKLRLKLASIYEKTPPSPDNDYDNFENAINVLKVIKFDKIGSEKSELLLKSDILLKLAQLYLECEQYDEADSYLNKAAMILAPMKEDKQNQEESNIRLRFKILQTDINDKHLKLSDSALKFYELSTFTGLPEYRRNIFLTRSIVALILSPPGSIGKYKTLSILLKDPRIPPSSSLELTENEYNTFKSYMDSLIRNYQIKYIYDTTYIDDENLGKVQQFIFTKFGLILNKMYNDEIITDNQFMIIQSINYGLDLFLLPHHSKVLRQILFEHNVFSISKIFNNITYGSMNHLISSNNNLSKKQIEHDVARMINEGRLYAQLDQINETLYFENDAVSRKGTSIQTSKVDAVCRTLDDIVKEITDLSKTEIQEE